MLEVLEFIFSGFWKFWGTALLLSIIMAGFAGAFHRD